MRSSWSTNELSLLESRSYPRYSKSAPSSEERGLMPAESTAIRLNAKQAIWWLLVTIQPLIVEVDGAPAKGTWGDQTLPVAPGSHRVSVSWKFYWILPVQKGTVDG